MEETFRKTEARENSREQEKLGEGIFYKYCFQIIVVTKNKTTTNYSCEISNARKQEIYVPRGEMLPMYCH